MAGHNAAAQGNAAAMFLHDFLRHPQSQPGAYVLLGGVEGFKTLLAMLRRNATAGVSNYDPSSGPVRVVQLLALAHTDTQRASLRQGVDGVGDQIRNYLPDLARQSGDMHAFIVFAGQLDAPGLNARQV